MKKSLVIVESPSKAKTINKFLGKDYTVKASVGHIRDLPESQLGINIEDKFKPKYVIKGKQKTINELKKAAKSSDEIYIATDPDREGEAIAWHIAEEIGNNKKVHRALFNEITLKAVQNAIDNPFPIDMQKVDAQQARRVIDRLVGYKVSPFLWRTLFKGSLSAGRVQSVALKLITELEGSIHRFSPTEYWTIHVDLNSPDSDILKAVLAKYKGVKAKIPDGETAQEIEQSYKNEQFTLKSIRKKKVKRNPFPPFITSTLQQEASNRLGYDPKKTMFIAQQLYEGIELGSEGSVGLISYMRTDSTRISNEALDELHDFIRKNYGPDFIPAKARIFKKKSKGKVQDAHECIRPSYFSRPPESLRQYLNDEQYKLYLLIWNRVVASQMKEAVSNQTTITISAGPCDFSLTGSELLFPGFLKIWSEQQIGDDIEENDASSNKIPSGLTEGMILEMQNSDLKQHFTKPPARFNDSSLVKELEQLGIGRPSTYAQIISTLITRNYITRDKRKLTPTELGEMVSKIVVKGFPDIIDVNFTAHMESELDLIESGKKNYFDVVDEFYKPFQENLDKVFGEIKTFEQELVEKAGFSCEKCGSEMVIRWSKNGKFYACSGFPVCKNAKSIENEDDASGGSAEPQPTGHVCKECGKDMVIRKGRYGIFFACSGYPSCKNTLLRCTLCGKDMKAKSKNKSKFYACTGHPDCKNIVNIVPKKDPEV